MTNLVVLAPTRMTTMLARLPGETPSASARNARRDTRRLR